MPAFVRACAAALAASFALLAHAQSPAPAPQPAAPPAPQQASATRHFLWEVISMTNRAWLFGTVHAGKQEWFPLAPEIERAFESSPVLVIEADVTDLEVVGKTAGTMSYQPPDTLANHVPPADYARFLTQIGRIGVPEERVKHMKPFTAGSLLMFAEWQRQGFLPQFGVDYYLITKAKAAKKKIVELEGVEAQSRLIDSLTEQEHRAAFAGTLTALESGLTADQIDGIIKAWTLGDAFLMLEVARRYNEKIPGAGAIEEKFIWSRHEAMMEKIEGFLNKEKERHFIAVGSLHLAGKRGLVELLRAKGYLVRQQ
jgi:uncharacterized protein YbaP (TraB family)